jgi:molybdopterin converting factor small subunit
MWMGDELVDFQSPTPMQSILQARVKEGTTVKQLFTRLAQQYPPIDKKIFREADMRFHPYVVTTLNHKVISPWQLHDKPLENGDTITVLPMYMGG